MKSDSLYFKSGNSDKVYHLQLLQVPNGYVVNFQYGRRGSTLKNGTKTENPVTLELAQKIYEKLMREKTSKGYSPSETGEVFSSEEYKNNKSNISLQLSNPISDEEVQSYIDDDSFLMQEKFDGERRGIDNTESPIGVNRKSLEVQLSDEIKKSFKTKGIFDGEDLGDKIQIFDILCLEGKDLRDTDLKERLSLLNTVKFGKNVKVAKTAYSKKEKEDLLQEIKDRNGEGVVFKKKTSKYTAGRPNSGGDHIKYKLYKTCTCIVSGQSKGKRSVELTLLENSEPIYVGKVTIPPNREIPSIDSLIEVRYLYAYKGGSLYQPVYLGERKDLDRGSATLSQLEYKEEIK